MILYFSATGNTKYCAEYIASRTGEESRSINDMMKAGVSSVNCAGAERLGIFVPVYAWDLAYSVADFLKDSRPVWTNDNCACCLACLHRCPKQAINRGRGHKWRAARPTKNGRYINPNVTM